MITFDGITLRLGGHIILDRASAALPPKYRVGLVGRNGAGKSSLLKLIAGLYEADDGTIEAPSGMRIGYVAQEAPGGRERRSRPCSPRRPSERPCSRKRSTRAIPSHR